MSESQKVLEGKISKWAKQLADAQNSLSMSVNPAKVRKWTDRAEYASKQLKAARALFEQFQQNKMHPSDQIHDAGHIYEPTAYSQGSLAASAESILEKAFQHMQDRAKTYDKPQGERSIPMVVELFNTIRGRDLTPEEGWLFMVLLKIVRANQGEFKLDSFEDLVAYSALYGEEAVNVQ